MFADQELRARLQSLFMVLTIYTFEKCSSRTLHSKGSGALLVPSSLANYQKEFASRLSSPSVQQKGLPYSDNPRDDQQTALEALKQSAAKRFNQQLDNRLGHETHDVNSATSEAEESHNEIQEATQSQKDEERSRISRLLFHMRRQTGVAEETDDWPSTDSGENDVLPKQSLSSEAIKNVIRRFVTRQDQCLIGDILYGPEACINFYYEYLVWYKERHPVQPDGELNHWERTVYNLLD